MLDSLGLTPTLEWLVREFEERSGVRVALTAPEDDMGASGDVATAVFRIVQEALTNVARHARAKNAAVSVARDDGDIRVCVSDDGKGIRPAGKGRGAVRSFGLLGMRERAYVLGGRFSVRAGERSGTVVEAVIPAQAAVARRQT
jgi:signal transduction histidine kinase